MCRDEVVAAKLRHYAAMIEAEGRHSHCSGNTAQGNGRAAAEGKNCSSARNPALGPLHVAGKFQPLLRDGVVMPPVFWITSFSEPKRTLGQSLAKQCSVFERQIGKRVGIEV
jgi:hypothetical protein